MKRKKRLKLGPLDTWGHLSITLDGQSMTGLTEIKYNPDGTKTITTGLPAFGNPIFDSSHPDFIPQQKILTKKNK